MGEGNTSSEISHKISKALSKPMSRRTFGKLAVAGAATGFAGGALQVEIPKVVHKVHPKKNDFKDLANVESEPPKSPFPDLFHSKDAQRVADKKGITPETFINIYSDSAKNILAKASAFKKDKIPPLFSPSVAQLGQFCRDLGEQFDIPAFFIMSIMQQESAGSSQVQSSQFAQGLFQVMPAHFNEFEGIEGIYSFENPSEPTPNDKAIMRDPIVNSTIAMRVLSDCIAKAREIAPGDKAETFLLAAQGYNAGESTIGEPFENLSPETKMYRENIARFFIAAEVADGLSEIGKTNEEIVNEMKSKEMDKRCFALMRWFEGNNSHYTYNQYKTKYEELASINPTDENYLDFDNQCNWTYPLNPALRAWYVTTGGALYENPALYGINFVPTEEWIKRASQTGYTP